MNTIKLNTIGERPIKKGGASGGGGNYVYYDIRGADLTNSTWLDAALSFSSIIRLAKDGFALYPPAGFAANYIQKGAVLQAFMIPTSLRYTQINTNNNTVTKVEWSTFDEVIKILDEANVPRITEEEFYDPNWGAGNGDDPM